MWELDVDAGVWTDLSPDCGLPQAIYSAGAYAGPVVGSIFFGGKGSTLSGSSGLNTNALIRVVDNGDVSRLVPGKFCL